MFFLNYIFFMSLSVFVIFVCWWVREVTHELGYNIKGLKVPRLKWSYEYRSTFFDDFVCFFWNIPQVLLFGMNFLVGTLILANCNNLKPDFTIVSVFILHLVMSVIFIIPIVLSYLAGIIVANLKIDICKSIHSLLIDPVVNILKD